MEFVPVSIIATIVFVFGIIIGSFLNVVIYRLHTSKSLNDRSHCLSCGKTLSWYELFPLFSYLGLRGKCMGCGARIPSRYFLVELLTGLLFLLVYFSFTDIVITGLHLVLIAILIVGLVYDLYHMIIPDEVVIAATAVSLSIVGYVSYLHSDVTEILYAFAAGAIAFFFYAFLWHVSKGRWIGFGDAKLAFPLGLLLGFSQVFSLIVLSFWVGAIVSIMLIAGQFLLHKWKTHLRFSLPALKMKSEIPFAPFLIAAFLLVLFFKVDVLSITTYVIEYLYN